MRTFIFDFDDTLAGNSIYNTWSLYLDIPLLRPVGGLLPGSREVLEFLSRRGDRIYMLTLNLVLDEEMKWRKIERLGIGEWFDEGNTFMVKDKTPEVFRRICRGSDPRRCYMVGNSFKRDIDPALRSGIKAIFIRRPLICRLFPDLHGDHENLIRMREIRQIVTRYREL
jgi:putative hydrolase of the HAD superfamily